MFELFDHTADLGLRLRAANLPLLFADGGHALASLIVENPAELRSQRNEPVALTAPSLEYLLFDWLSDLLYRFERNRFLPAAFNLKVESVGPEWKLTGIIAGEPADEARHRLDHEVKAITYHGLKVEQTPAGWLAEVIVDI